jgi:SAM-dependent methyltransferase
MTAAAEYWSAKSASGYATNWYGFCAAEITRRVTGQTVSGITPWLIEANTTGTVDALLEIGCLKGTKTLAYKGKLAREVAGVDIAAGAIEEGRKEYGDSIDLRVMDLNQPEPMDREFDIIVANGVLHHIENLEACAEWISDHLAPGGILIASEFTGPVRYRYSRREIALINEGVGLLPDDLQFKFDPASLQSKLNSDPSEAIRTRDIGDVLNAVLGEVEVIPYGGNVLMRALDSRYFFPAFDASKPEHVEGVNRIVQFDRDVMMSEPNHHNVFIAKKAIAT